MLWSIPVLATSNLNAGIVDASTEWFNVGFQAPKTGTIDRIVFTVDAAGVTGTAPTYRFGIETIGTTYAWGSGTYAASGGAYVDQQPANGTTHVMTLGSSVSVTAGDILACTMRYQSGTINGSNYVRVPSPNIQTPLSSYQQNWPIGQVLSTGSPPTIVSNSSYILNVVPLYSDDTPAYLHSRIISGTVSNTWANGDEIGSQFRLSKPARMTFATYFIRQNSMGTGDTITLRLWDDQGTALWSRTYNYQELTSNIAAAQRFPLDTPIQIQPFRWYRLTAHIIGYSNPQNLESVFSSGGLVGMYGTFPKDRFWDFRRTTRTYNASWNEGDWTQTEDVWRMCTPGFDNIGENLSLVKPRRVI